MNTIIDGKGEKQPTPPPNLGEAETYDIFSSRSHAMDYFTVEGVKLRTGYDSIKDWYIMVVQQCLDNSVDFLQKYYKGYGDTYVDVWITKDAKNKLLRITVRNSNYRNIPVLKNLEHIFNFEMRYGSKQNEKVISRGILGDALKQILSLPYVLLHSKDSSDKGGFKNQQWKHPLIVRRNGQESHVWVIVDIYNQHTTLDIRPIGTNEAVELEGKKRESDNGDDGEDEEEDDDNNNSTEIEVFLPLLTDSNASISMTDIEFFCRKYPIWTTDISSRFSLTNIRDGDDDGESKTTSTEIIFDVDSSLIHYVDISL